MWKLATLATISLALVLISSATFANGGGGAGIVVIGGTYSVDVNVLDDPAGHEQFVGMPEKIEVFVEITPDIKGDSVSIFGEAPFVEVHGFIEPDGQISATGQGTVADFEDIQVDFQGKLTPGGLNGEYAMGIAGGLPNEDGQGDAIVYLFKKQEEETPTPEDKLYSITVLKLDAANNQPLADWVFNLFAGSCFAGEFITSGITDGNGLHSFPNLAPGLYSLVEFVQTGWNVVPEEDECQEVEVPGTAGSPAGQPQCPVQPDAAFPQPGCDGFDSGGRVIVRLNGSNTTFPVTLNGPTMIARHTAPTNVDGLDEIETEIVSMELSGGGISVSLSPDQQSNGAITEQKNNTPGTLEFPATSFFDIFLEVDLGGPILHNNEPFHLECKIDAIPPIGCFYQPPIDDPIILFDAQEVKVATIEHALHIPLPPKETLVVFTNERKGTPTPTATPDEKSYSITVLKLDADTNDPLEDWKFELYAGDCESEEFIESRRTDGDGLLDFVDLPAGRYSIDEVPQPDWNVVPPEDVCQEVTLPSAAGAPAGVPPCPVVPDAEFPQPGCETFNSGARVIVTINATGDSFAVTLNGPTQIARHNKPTDVGGFDTIQTEIVSMQLSGGGISVRALSNPAAVASGTITEQENNEPGVLEFPAKSFFDIFLEVDLGGPILHNNEPLRMQCKIEEIPPIGCFYQPPIDDPIDLFDENNVKIAKITHAIHIPLPPKETLVVFTNEHKVPPSPTPTPSEKLYTLTVLKLNADGNQPIPGWGFDLYAGGCSGEFEFLQTGFGGDNGTVEFAGLPAGLYSVDEHLIPGWNAVPPDSSCQEVDLPAAAGGPAGLPPCPVVPDAAFPQPGCDSFNSSARVVVTLNDSDFTTAFTLSGPTLIVRRTKPADTDGDGLDQIETEIVSMDLSGGSLSVRLSPTLVSPGEIEEQANNEPGTLEFPATSFFDVFVEADFGSGVVLHNEEPIRLECKIGEIPPLGCFYQPPIDDPIDLFDEDGVKIAKIQHAIHVPLPPKKALLIFTNERKASGDVNCDDLVDSRDALLILQLIAALFFELPCPEGADVNLDDLINSLDSLLILQFIADFIDQLPIGLTEGAGPHQGIGTGLPW